MHKLSLFLLLIASACPQESRPQERREERRERRHRKPVPQPRAGGPWSGVLDSSRGVDWSRAGVIGGIPTNRTQCVPSAPNGGAGHGDILANGTIMPHGGTDITDATNINAALQTCPANTYLLLGSGTFYIVNGLTFGGPTNANGFTLPISNVTLRGSGADQTILRIRTGGQQDCGAYASAVCIWGNSQSATQWFYPYQGACAWTAGYAKDSTQLTLGSCYSGTMPTIGQIIILDQRNDDVGLAGCTSSGTTATCTVSTATLPPIFTVGACVGVGGVNRSTTMTGYNVHMMAPQTNPSTCNAITAVSGNTFSYTMSGGLSNQPAAGPCTAVQPWPSSSPAVSATNTQCGWATVDTGGVMVTGNPCVTADGNGTDCIGGGLVTGRTCPDPQARNPSCDPQEISWRSQIQIVTVTNVVGSVITIDTPLYGNNWRASQAPGIWWTSVWLQGDGIENMTWDARNDGGTNTSMITYFQHCYNCWVKGVRSISGNRNHIWLQNGVAHTTVRDSYFFDTKGGATTSYGIEMFWPVSSVLAENNILNRVVCALMNGGNYGSVESYNYLSDDGSYSTGYMMGLIFENHDVNQYNLYESNSSPADVFDNIHGTSGTQTLFRQRLRGQSIPLKINGLKAVTISSFNRGQSIIGSVFGTTFPSNLVGITPLNTYQADGTAGSPCDSLRTVWCLGATSQSGNTIRDDPLVRQTLFRWGNYDIVTGATRWCGTGSETGCGGVSEIPAGSFFALPQPSVPGTHTLPPSFYLTSRPAFYATKWGTPAWPSIGPDVTSGTATGPDATGDTAGGGMVYQIPAGLVANNMPIDPAFVGSNTVTGATWVIGSYIGNSLATLTGTFSLPIYGTFQLTGMTPAAYNGKFMVNSLDGPSVDPGNNNSTSASGGSNPANANYRIRFTRVNQWGETQGSGSGGALMSSTCPASGNCAIYLPAVPSSVAVNGLPAGNPQAATGVNIYVNDRADPSGKYCKQNATPWPIATNYTQTAAACTGLNLAACGNTSGQCIEPPTTNTAISKTLTYYLTVNPGGGGTGGTMTAPLVQVFNADQYYYGAAGPTTPSGITGHGTITGQGKIT